MTASNDEEVVLEERATDFTPEERALLEGRTRALAKRPAEAVGEAALTEVVVFRAGGDAYAVEARAVSAVAALTHLTPLPHAPPTLAGVTARGGAVLPVFLLRAVLGQAASLSEHDRLLILGEGDDAVALAVDSVERIDAVALATLREPPAGLGPDARAFVRGVTTEGLPVLNAGALLASERLVVDIRPPRVER